MFAVGLGRVWAGWGGVMEEPGMIAGSRTMPDVLLELKREREGREKAELDLAARQKDFSYLFDKNPLAMWIYERKDLRFVEVNEAAVLQYGYKREEFLAMGLADMLPVRLVEELRSGHGAEAR